MVMARIAMMVVVIVVVVTAMPIGECRRTDRGETKRQKKRLSDLHPVTPFKLC
jgi:hypothetical protein